MRASLDAGDSEGVSEEDADGDVFTPTSDTSQGEGEDQGEASPAVAPLLADASVDASPGPTEASLDASAVDAGCTLSDTGALGAEPPPVLVWCPPDQRFPVCTAGVAPWPDFTLSEVSVQYLSGFYTGTDLLFLGQRDGARVLLEVLVRDPQQRAPVLRPGDYQAGPGIAPSPTFLSETKTWLVEEPIAIHIARHEAETRAAGSSVQLSGQMTIGSFTASFDISRSCGTPISF